MFIFFPTIASNLTQISRFPLHIEATSLWFQKVPLPFRWRTGPWSKPAIFPCEYSTPCVYNWVQRSVSTPIRALAPPFQFDFHTHFLNFEWFLFLPTLSGLLLISDPANKIQIIIHYIFPGAAAGSILRPAQSLHARLKPGKRSSLCMAVNVSALIGLLALDWLIDWLLIHHLLAQEWFLMAVLFFLRCCDTAAHSLLGKWHS